MIELFRPAVIEMCPLHAYISSLQDNVAWQLPLQSEIPALFIGCRVNATEGRLNALSHKGQEPLRIKNRWIRTRARKGIAQPRPRCDAVILISGYPRSRLRKPLETGADSSDGAVSWRVIKDSVTATGDQHRLQFVGKTKSRAEVLVIDAGDVSMAGTGINQPSVKVGKSGRLERRCHIRIQIVHVVETLGARQADIVTQTQIERELVGRSKVVLNESGMLEALRGGPVGDVVTPGVSEAQQKTRHGVPTPGYGELRGPGVTEVKVPGRRVRLQEA